MASVFLSYARADMAKATPLAGALEQLGHSVWWDRRLQGGSRFSEEIEQALKCADAVVVLWSHASVRSAWVQDEAAEGRDSGRLIPVLLDDSKPPLGFRQYQSIELKGWQGRTNAPAIDSLHQAIVGRAGSADRAKASTPHRHVRLDYRRFGIAAASILLLLFATMLYRTGWPAARHDPDALRLQLGEFASLSQDVPRKVPDTLREEMLGALATDAVILASADQPAAGSQPGYALRASVGRAEALLQFTVHVVNNRTGATVWTGALERPAGDMDIAPRQVAVAVSQVLRCGLGAAARHRKPIVDATLSIFFNYCGEYWADTMGKQMNATRALDLAHRVTEAAPDFSRGWSALANAGATVWRENGYANAGPLRSEALRAAKRAIDLDPENSEAYQALAGFEPPFAFSAREKQHLKSISVQPSDCGCEYVGYGGLLSRVGRNREAANALKRAHDMIPLSADVNTSWAQALFLVDRTDAARDAAANALKLWPDHSGIREVLVSSAFWTGNYDEALHLLEDTKTPASEPERQALRQALQVLKRGDSTSKSAVVRELSELAAAPSAHVSLLITALGALGAGQEALALAATRIQRDGPFALPVLFQPALAEARASPQFGNIARRFGLVSYWKQSRQLPDFCKDPAPPPLCATL